MSTSSRGSFIDKHLGDGSLYLQEPSHGCNNITAYSLFPPLPRLCSLWVVQGPRMVTQGQAEGIQIMSPDVKMLIELLSGERGNQTQDPAVPLSMQFLANLIVIIRRLTGYTIRTHCPLPSRHFGPIKATSVSSRQFKCPKALSPCYACIQQKSILLHLGPKTDMRDFLRFYACLE